MIVPSAKKYFNGRTAVIATQHAKERVIAPQISEAFGLNAIVLPDYNTDLLGTFSGEVERKGDVIEVLKMKCWGAMEQSKAEIGIANEGSFGPHPSAYFSYADEEWMILIDRRNGWEIIERVVSLATNFNAASFSDWNEIVDFADKVQFPSHGLIAKASRDDIRIMEKGIAEWNHLRQVCERTIAHHGEVYLETDMRAMYNPTRMLVISDATRKLIEKVNNMCPKCSTPGFGIRELMRGLPCQDCGFPTHSVLEHIYGCNSCNFQSSVAFPDGKKFESPMYCNLCNP